MNRSKRNTSRVQLWKVGAALGAAVGLRAAAAALRKHAMQGTHDIEVVRDKLVITDLTLDGPGVSATFNGPAGTRTRLAADGFTSKESSGPVTLTVGAKAGPELARWEADGTPVTLRMRMSVTNGAVGPVRLRIDDGKGTALLVDTFDEAC